MDRISRQTSTIKTERLTITFNGKSQRHELIPLEMFGAYLVRSRSVRDGWHLIVVQAGTCDCEHFRHYRGCGHLQAVGRWAYQQRQAERAAA